MTRVLTQSQSLGSGGSEGNGALARVILVVSNIVANQCWDEKASCVDLQLRESAPNLKSAREGAKRRSYACSDHYCCSGSFLTC